MPNSGAYRKIKPCAKCKQPFAALGQKNANGTVQWEDAYCDKCRG